MALLSYPFMGFVVILLASVLLFGEVLVKVRGVFGTIGSGLFVMFLSYHLTDSSPLGMILLLAVGIVLIIIDGQIFNNGTVAVIGIIMMLLACVLPVPSILYGTLVGLAFIIGLTASFLFLKSFQPRDYWSRLTLKDQLTSEQGYNSMNEGYRDLVGKTGRAKTPFRPVGTIIIDGVTYSAVTSGEWIEPGEQVIVKDVDGTKILIQSQKGDAPSN
ncbi:NfeD family protein [Tuberibacillus sp. Marseille-P3662]|uniref:NfeD family protein n=1 Tax=Tuberibacillus sp. Marseille-P3662 TaxID=1965358 RepID=UPI00111BE328|nr:NfeD family protein [Tuberibacillus sp. Marseille-P3662]